ncbi:MAG: polysaccharide deacetylase family protein [Pseudomonadota bacterium]
MSFLGYPTAGFGHSYPANHGHANYGLSVPATSSTGDYTVSWNGGQYMFLHESVNGGPSQVIYEGTASSFQLTGKSDATYTYVVVGRACSIGGCWGIFGNEQSIVVAATGSSPVLGFDGDYSAVGGDLDGDGDTDVFVIYTGSSPLPAENTAQTVLINNGNGSFALQPYASLTGGQKAIVDSWQTVVGSPKLGDFNEDGAYDIYLDLPAANFSMPVDDVLIFADPQSQDPATHTQVDTEFVEFFHQLDAWVQNPNYFEDNAPTTTESLPVTTGTGWYYFATSQSGLNSAELACVLEHGFGNCTYYIGYLADVFSPADCLLLAADGIPCNRFGAHVFGFSLTTVFVDVVVPDYSGFNQDALALAKGALQNAIDLDGIVSGSADGIEIANIIEAILGIEIYHGVFSSSSANVPHEEDFNEDINQFERLRWLIDYCLLILEYLSEEGSPDDGGSPMPVPILLTFDDGPHPTSVLSAIVAALAVEGVLADFYVIGQEVAVYQSETAALITSGHKVQNHTWSHPGEKGTTTLIEMTQAQVNQEIGDAQAAIIDATDVAPTRFRAPYGIGGYWNNVDPKVQAAADMYSLDVIHWDVDPRDWEENKDEEAQGLNERNIPKSVLLARAFAVRPGISRVNVLLHVTPNTALGLVPFIEALELAGFSFATPP